MEKLIKKINIIKNDRSSLNGYIKVFASNEKAKELFKNSKSFDEVKKYITTKKVS